MPDGPVIALIDGEHHPRAVRDALDALDRERRVAAVVLCGGNEKLSTSVLEAPADHYGRPVHAGEPPAAALERLVAEDTLGARAVVDLADEPVLGPSRRLRLAATALHLGLAYEAPGLLLAPPPYESIAFDGPTVAVIGTGKRTGKTAVAGHWARLLADRGREPILVAMGRGGPTPPRRAQPGVSLGELLELSAVGEHAASDYLEAAALSHVAAIGARRVGGGLAGEPFESNVAEAGALAASTAPGVIVFDGSGACIPPVAVDKTVCVVGDREGALCELGPYRLLRADLALVPDRPHDPRLAADVAEHAARVERFELIPEPVETLPRTARVAAFSTGAPAPEGIDAVVASTNLARRSALERDLERASKEHCDVYLTELKAGAIDTVAAHARDIGVRVVLVRNRPVGLDCDLDGELLGLL